MQASGKHLASIWQGVGKEFASSSKLFELAKCLRKVWEE